MATPKTCRRCGTRTHFTKISMLDYYDICYPCEKKENKDKTLVVSKKLKDKGYFEEQANTLINIHRHNRKWKSAKQHSIK